MSAQHDCVTLVLAGGRGERLGALTKETPKPAVSFGGAYRLIDFTLSNCAHSRLSPVGVVTQYRQAGLTDYIGTGAYWTPEDGKSAINILPLQARSGRSGYYKGTADAIRKNWHFIERFHPENILVLSGDHIYRMDYSQLLDTHNRSGADCTIAALPVSMDEAPDFGIIQATSDGRILGFEEKPRIPRSDLASMGIYVFRKDKLQDYLHIDGMDALSQSDIGHNIIPLMLMMGEKMVVHRFGGYWKDVGSIYGLWDAHMALLDTPPQITLRDQGWQILSRDRIPVRHFSYYASGDLLIDNSIVADGCHIAGYIARSVISPSVTIGQNAVVSHAVVMPGATIGKNAVVHNAIIDANAVVGDHMVIDGASKDDMQAQRNRGVALYSNTPAWDRPVQVR